MTDDIKRSLIDHQIQIMLAVEFLSDGRRMLLEAVGKENEAEAKCIFGMADRVSAIADEAACEFEFRPKDDNE